jgi:hypothetical protein
VHGDAQDKNLLLGEGGGLVAIDPSRHWAIRISTRRSGR